MKIPKAKYITKYRDRINFPFEKLFALDAERQMRCGDGSGNGKIVSHSTNCNCKEIEKKIKLLEAY